MDPYFLFMKLFKKIAIYTFLVIAAVLWVIIFLHDTGVMHGDTKWLKFATIATCFVFSLLHLRNVKTHFFIGAMLFTVISDWILVVNFKASIVWIALVTFSISQILHWLDVKGYKNLMKSVIWRAGSFVALTILLIILIGFNTISILTAFYFANLVINVVDSFKAKFKGHIIMGIAFILFMLCDICVGWTMSNFAGSTNPVVSFLTTFTAFGMWMFYVPSQALLVYSNYYRYEK